MKMKRLVATMLVLLLVTSLLPITALADTLPDNKEGDTVSVGSGDTMDVNNGTVTTNRGTVGTNNGTVTENKKNVGINNGKIATSNGTVTENNKQIDTNAFAGKVETNNDTVVFNKGTVKTNAEDGTVKYNYGKVETNQGTVNQNTNLIRNGETVQSGSIDINKGTVDTNDTHVNQNEGTVATNNGTVTTNRGTVGTNNGTVTENKKNVGINNGKIATSNGTVTENNKQIDTNAFAGKVETNNDTVVFNKGTVKTNAEDGTVDKNWGNITDNNGNVNTNERIIKNGVEFRGVIENNNGTVKTNGEGGTIENNSGTVGSRNDDDEGTPNTQKGNHGVIYGNTGTVIFNDGVIAYNGAKVEKNAAGGVNMVEGTTNPNATVELNQGTIYENYGTIGANAEDGEVFANYGTVVNTQGGKLHEYVYEYTDDEDPGEETSTTITEAGTYYGVLIDKGDAPEGAEAGTWKNGMALLQKKLDEVLDLGSIFKQDGYKVIGYQKVDVAVMAMDEDAAGSEMVPGTEYRENMPGWLRLIWEKIKTVVKPSASSGDPEAKTVKKTVPTSLSGDQLKAGAYVRRGNMTFVIIEVTDNDIRVATAGKLSEQDLADMLGCLKKHLSDAQIAKINGEPALLEQELVNYFFGGRNEHIAFRAARDLFA